MIKEIIQREFIYLWYYSSVQLNQIFPYWILGTVIGSLISVFAKDSIHRAFIKFQNKKFGIINIIIASALGIASPLCMYGTIPIAASFSKNGIKDDILSAFMMSSILLNPQLIIYTASLGHTVLFIRIISCFACGVVAGLCIKYFYKGANFFNFSGFTTVVNKDTDSNAFIRLLKNIYRNIKATGIYFVIGIILSAMFQRYIKPEWIEIIFNSNKGFGVLMAATIGVPLYACGGGTIPLIGEWLSSGMSLGSVASFMITGPATKITNLGALKIVLGLKCFVIYIVYIMLFAIITGLLII